MKGKFEHTQMVGTSENRGGVHMGCAISFVVLAPFELTEKCTQGKVSFKESCHNISAVETYLCVPLHFRSVEEQ